MYMDLVMLLNFLIDFLLMLGTNRLCGYPPGYLRAGLGAGVGGLYGGLCLIPGFQFLGKLLWRVVSLGVMGYLAFGCSKSAVRRCAVFVLLSMALGGIALGIGNGGFYALLAAFAMVGVICAIGFRGTVGATQYVPVELKFGSKNIRLLALQDSGNMLRDPLTGRAVLVINSDAAIRLTGLTLQHLQDPVKAMAEAPIPGLRLIPYRALGQPGGMLLAVRMEGVKIGSWKGSSLVAFAPSGLSDEGGYQALTGGII